MYSSSSDLGGVDVDARQFHGGDRFGDGVHKDAQILDDKQTGGPGAALPALRRARASASTYRSVSPTFRRSSHDMLQSRPRRLISSGQPAAERVRGVRSGPASSIRRRQRLAEGRAGAACWRRSTAPCPAVPPPAAGSVRSRCISCWMPTRLFKIVEVLALEVFHQGKDTADFSSSNCSTMAGILLQMPSIRQAISRRSPAMQLVPRVRCWRTVIGWSNPLWADAVGQFLHCPWDQTACAAGKGSR